MKFKAKVLLLINDLIQFKFMATKPFVIGLCGCCISKFKKFLWSQILMLKFEFFFLCVLSSRNIIFDM